MRCREEPPCRMVVYFGYGYGFDFATRTILFECDMEPPRKPA
jgi:hypothetical protein